MPPSPQDPRPPSLHEVTALAIGDAVGLERAKIQHDAARKITRVVTSRAETGVDVSVPRKSRKQAIPSRNL